MRQNVRPQSGWSRLWTRECAVRSLGTPLRMQDLATCHSSLVRAQMPQGGTGPNLAEHLRPALAAEGGELKLLWRGYTTHVGSWRQGQSAAAGRDEQGSAGNAAPNGGAPATAGIRRGEYPILMHWVLAAVKRRRRWSATSPITFAALTTNPDARRPSGTLRGQSLLGQFGLSRRLRPSACRRLVSLTSQPASIPVVSAVFPDLPW